jgi:hypothetical protein
LDAEPDIRFDGDAADKVAFIDKTTKMREGVKAASEKKKFDSMLSKFLDLILKSKPFESATSRPRP